MIGGSENAFLMAEDLGKDSGLPPLAKILDLLSDIAAEGTYGTRAEWLYKFERTLATNEPAILFADAFKLGILIEEIPGTFCFVKPEQPPVDAGLWKPNADKLNIWKQKQQEARRARQYA